MKEKNKTGISPFLQDDIPNEVMGKLQDAYQASGRSPSLECPSPETIIAYALEELSPERRKQVHSHLSNCRNCVDLVLDLRSARAESEETNQELPGESQTTYATSKGLTGIRGRAGAMISRLLSFPKLVPAAVAVLVLVVVVFLGVYQHPTAPINIYIDLTHRGTEGFLTRGLSEEKEILVPIGGVLHSGDRFRVAFETNKDAYVYVFLKDSTGKITLLYFGKVLGSKRYKLPGENAWFKLNAVDLSPIVGPFTMAAL